MKIKFAPSARQQFLSAIAYIAADSPGAARRVRVRVEKALHRLSRFPNVGRRIPEFPELPHRELIVPPYRIFYRIAGKVIWVVAMWHGAQDPKAPAGSEGSF
jgi:plasmid stabilization system protein ParE